MAKLVVGRGGGDGYGGDHGGVVLWSGCDVGGVAVAVMAVAVGSSSWQEQRWQER